MDLISALYPKEGGPLLGFACRIIIHGEGPKFPHECGQLFKTEDGAWLHAASAHGILREPKLPVVQPGNESIKGPDDTLQDFRLTTKND